MRKQAVISFPHMGDYHVPIGGFFRVVLPDVEVRSAPPITKRTAALGERYSPDFICAPFKYNMGNFLEALEDGATVLLQTGTGCRYGYYGELQGQILGDLGYEPTFLCLSRGRVRPDRVYRALRDLGSPRRFPQMVHAFRVTMEQIRGMDQVGRTVRENVAFAKHPADLREVYAGFLEKLPLTNSIREVRGLTQKTKRQLGKIPLDIPTHPLRVGIVGDLYTVMEPFSNADIERKLAERGILVSREMSVSFLLSSSSHGQAVRRAGGYVRHHIGANGLDSVVQTLKYARAGYDGVLHLKAFGCTPELNAAPAMANIGRDYEMPILSMSFDTHQGDAGVDTRLEAFVDMMEMKRRGQSGGRI